MSDPKPCKVCNFSRQKTYGLVVSSLDQLKTKGSKSLGFNTSTSVSVVLEDDGTIVEDEDYFLCLPSHTTFMLLDEKETWAPLLIDRSRARMTGGSVNLECDAVDSSITLSHPWFYLAQQLKQDLASVILMSETDLQTLVDVPCPELAFALGFPERKVQSLQATLQGVLDRREEERQSKELLQLYLKAMEKEDSQEETPSQDGSVKMDVMDGMEVDSVSGFTSTMLMVLKYKKSPETRLSSEELQMVVNKGVVAMEQVLGWDSGKTTQLLQACEEQLSMRLQQVQAMQSLRHSTRQHPSDETQETRAKRRK
ncbi:DNA fragmentation factor subunit alpha isoform X2 [Esox lucius]|uniref:CIDE-N domain-containing protein n=1 Tax=Esox lucius TaxID=8010 RepID=A0A3P8YA85_ESOLU|nr:DNA fragmentation factor subunit alpha isoform X2 [Esox lucius]